MAQSKRSRTALVGVPPEFSGQGAADPKLYAFPMLDSTLVNTGSEECVSFFHPVYPGSKDDPFANGNAPSAVRLGDHPRDMPMLFTRFFMTLLKLLPAPIKKKLTGGILVAHDPDAETMSSETVRGLLFFFSVQKAPTSSSDEGEIEAEATAQADAAEEEEEDSESGEDAPKKEKGTLVGELKRAARFLFKLADRDSAFCTKEFVLPNGTRLRPPGVVHVPPGPGSMQWTEMRNFDVLKSCVNFLAPSVFNVRDPNFSEAYKTYDATSLLQLYTTKYVTDHVMRRYLGDDHEAVFFFNQLQQDFDESGVQEWDKSDGADGNYIAMPLPRGYCDKALCTVIPVVWKPQLTAESLRSEYMRCEPWDHGYAKEPAEGDILRYFYGNLFPEGREAAGDLMKRSIVWRPLSHGSSAGGNDFLEVHRNPQPCEAPGPENPISVPKLAETLGFLLKDIPTHNPVPQSVQSVYNNIMLFFRESLLVVPESGLYCDFMRSFVKYKVSVDGCLHYVAQLSYTVAITPVGIFKGRGLNPHTVFSGPSAAGKSVLLDHMVYFNFLNTTLTLTRMREYSDQNMGKVLKQNEIPQELMNEGSYERFQGNGTKANYLNATLQILENEAVHHERCERNEDGAYSAQRSGGATPCMLYLGATNYGEQMLDSAISDRINYVNVPKVGMSYYQGQSHHCSRDPHTGEVHKGFKFIFNTAALLTMVSALKYVPPPSNPFRKGDLFRKIINGLKKSGAAVKDSRAGHSRFIELVNSRVEYCHAAVDAVQKAVPRFISPSFDENLYHKMGIFLVEAARGWTVTLQHMVYELSLRKDVLFSETLMHILSVIRRGKVPEFVYTDSDARGYCNIPKENVVDFSLDLKVDRPQLLDRLVGKVSQISDCTYQPAQLQHAIKMGEEQVTIGRERVICREKLVLKVLKPALQQALTLHERLLVWALLKYEFRFAVPVGSPMSSGAPLYETTLKNAEKHILRDEHVSVEVNLTSLALLMEPVMDEGTAVTVVQSYFTKLGHDAPRHTFFSISPSLARDLVHAMKTDTNPARSKHARILGDMIFTHARVWSKETLILDANAFVAYEPECAKVVMGDVPLEKRPTEWKGPMEITFSEAQALVYGVYSEPPTPLTNEAVAIAMHNLAVLNGLDIDRTKLEDHKIVLNTPFCFDTLEVLHKGPICQWLRNTKNLTTAPETIMLSAVAPDNQPIECYYDPRRGTEELQIKTQAREFINFDPECKRASLFSDEI